MLTFYLFYLNFFRKDPELTDGKIISNTDLEWINMNYIPFGEKSMAMVIKMYQGTADLDVVIKNDILYELIKVKFL